jgi:hypothetical protein
VESILTHAEWSVELLEGDDAFDRCAPDWDRLYRRCSTATPFQARQWLQSWWRHYGGDSGRLCLIGVRYRGELVAACALMLRRHGPWRVARPVGTRESDFCDVLVDDSGVHGTPDPRRSVEHLAVAIRDELRFDALDFGDVRPTAAAVRIYQTWPGRRAAVPGMLCLSFPARPILEAVDGMSGHARRRLKAKIRKIDDHGLQVRRVPCEEAAQAVADLLALHHKQWSGRGISREHLRPRFAAHLAAVATLDPGPAAADHPADFEAILFEYSRKLPEADEPEVVALDLMLVGNGLLGDYLYGHEPGLRLDLDVSTMFVRTDLAYAHSRGLAEMSLLRGAEQHKLRLRPSQARNTRFLMAGTAWGAGWLRAVRTRRFGVRVLKKLLHRQDGGSRPGRQRWTRGSWRSATPRPGSSRRSSRRGCRGWRSSAASK